MIFLDTSYNMNPDTKKILHFTYILKTKYNKLFELGHFAKTHLMKRVRNKNVNLAYFWGHQISQVSQISSSNFLPASDLHIASSLLIFQKPSWFHEA